MLIYICHSIRPDGSWSTFTINVGHPPMRIQVPAFTQQSYTWKFDNLGHGSLSDCNEARGSLPEILECTSWFLMDIPNMMEPVFLGSLLNGDDMLRDTHHGRNSSGPLSGRMNFLLLSPYFALDIIWPLTSVQFCHPHAKPGFIILPDSTTRTDPMSKDLLRQGTFNAGFPGKHELRRHQLPGPEPTKEAYICKDSWRWISPIWRGQCQHILSGCSQYQHLLSGCGQCNISYLDAVNATYPIWVRSMRHPQAV